MRKFLSFLFFVMACFGYSEDLEVRLSTRSLLPSLYISSLRGDGDWRYLEELKSILEFDLANCGYCSLLSSNADWDDCLRNMDLQKSSHLAFWKKNHVSFILLLESLPDQFQLTAVQVDKSSFKTYPPFTLTGQMQLDRRQIHKLADRLQKDLFYKTGVASSRLIYTQRTKNLGSGCSDWLSEICLCDADGANSEQVTHSQNYCLTPFFLPRKQKDADFYFVAHQGGQSKIYKASLENPIPKQMLSLRGNQLLASFSKKGTHLAFISDTAGRPDLFIQHFDSRGEPAGKARQLFSAPRATQASPTFSPDATLVAFVSDKDGPPRIYSMPVDPYKAKQKPNPKLLTKRNRENTSPSWSPDGKKIAYSAKVDGVRQIWIYNVETEEEMPLTTGGENKENPSWAPNSFHLVYNTESEESSELFLINLEQKTPVCISKGPGQKRFPSWEPDY